MNFSTFSMVTQRKTWRLHLALTKNFFLWAALFFFSLSICNPESLEFSTRGRIVPPRQGIAIYLLIDKSSSMAESLGGDISKMDLVKKITKTFVEDRKNDLIGLIGFARAARLLSPLTIDHEELLDRLEALSVVKNEDENGTAIGYAIFKAVNLIVSAKHFAEQLKEKKEPSYEIKNQIIVVLTDGLQSPNPLDRNNQFRFMRPEEAVSFAKQNDIRVYFVGLVSPQEEPFFLEQTQKLQEALNAANGGFFLSTAKNSLDQVYAKINQLEKSEIPSTLQETQRTSLVPFCLLLGIISLLIAVAIETIFARKFP